MRSRKLALTSMLALFATQSAAAAPIWNEGVDGDLSNDRLNPTALTLAVGSNTITGSVTAGERDYFRFNVPTGYSVTQLVLSAYSPSNLGFLAVQSGTQITVDPGLPSATPLLGYVHTGPQVGTDILDDLGASNLLAPPAQGFVPPLGPGDYSFWMQQTSAIVTSYTFDVVVVPEPSAAPLLGLGLAALALIRRRCA